MTGAWGASLDQLWHSLSPTGWIALAVAAVFVLFALVALLRAEKSVANAVLAALAVLAIGVAVAITVRGPTGSRHTASAESPAPPQASPAVMSCLDGLAGDAVEAACERPLFASAESAAAAVSYTAAQMIRLASAAARAPDDRKIPPELSALRRTLEHDRYGMVAHVLAVRDGCTPSDCAFYAVLTDHNQIAANMTERAYEGLIGRYALSWNNNAAAAPAPAAAAPPAAAAGRPVSGDFPSSSSIPPVNIMTSEPGGAAAPAAAGQGSKPVAAATPRPVTPPAAAAPAAAPAVKKPAPKKPPAPAPVPLAPAPPADDNQQ
ncbi:MAG: hypothetical protein P4M07_00565 [Xanthobacteraceae bacterium]|nr:hypothetical protein [Xanthobacteraceae bacterium]